MGRAEKKKDEKALFFTQEQAIKRLDKLGDLFEPVLTLEQELPKQFTEAINAGPKRKLSSW